MVQKRFYNIQELATILGKTVAAIHGHLARKQFDAVPPPMHLGRRLAWLVEYVDAWIEAKADKAAAQAEAYLPSAQNSLKRHGRPTKAEVKARERSVTLPGFRATIQQKTEDGNVQDSAVLSEGGGQGA